MSISHDFVPMFRRKNMLSACIQDSWAYRIMEQTHRMQTLRTTANERAFGCSVCEELQLQRGSCTSILATDVMFGRVVSTAHRKRT